MKNNSSYYNFDKINNFLILNHFKEFRIIIKILIIIKQNKKKKWKFGIAFFAFVVVQLGFKAVVYGCVHYQ